jgi:hypothetical protein
MLWNPFSQNRDGGASNIAYTPGGGYEKRSKLAMIIILVVGIIVGISILVLGIQFFLAKSEQAKITNSATTAASKHTPSAQVSNVKVADGYALAIVSDPNATSQANAGNTTIFKVNKDGSMVQIANASYFSPIDLLVLGIPLATQAKLTGNTVSQVQQTLADACNYNTSGDTPGYSGFDGSFNPGGWQIDSGALNDIEQTLTTAIASKNSGVNSDKKIICVNVSQNNSDTKTDLQTYISTFTLELQFITSDGTLTTHTFNFSVGPRNYRSYILDGQAIMKN